MPAGQGALVIESSRPLHILHVVQGYLPAVGGTERVIQRLSEELVRQFGDTVSVFTTDAYSAEAFPRPSLPRLATGWWHHRGVAVRRFHTVRAFGPVLNQIQKAAWRLQIPGNQHIRTLYGGPLVPGLARAIAAHPADIVSSSSFPLAHMYAALRGARAARRPCVFLGGLHPEDRWGYERARIHRAIRRVDRYVSYTEFEKRFVVEHGADPARVAVVPLGVDAEPFLAARPAEARQRLGIGPGGPVVGFVGQLGVNKGVATLIEAMPGVWARYPGAWLVIAGHRTTYSQRLEAMLATLPTAMRERVVKIEDFPDALRPDLFAALDILAYPSGFESYGLSFLEAWAAGRPVVGCRRGAVGDVVEDERDGLLVPYEDAAALTNAVLRLAADPAWARALGAAGRRRVRERHTWPEVARKIRQVYCAAVDALPSRDGPAGTVPEESALADERAGPHDHERHHGRPSGRDA